MVNLWGRFIIEKGVCIFEGCCSFYKREVLSSLLSYFKLNIENRIENQINVFDGYAQDQADLLKEAVIDIQSNYALYVVLENAKEVDNAFLLAL